MVAFTISFALSQTKIPGWVGKCDTMPYPAVMIARLKPSSYRAISSSRSVSCEDCPNRKTRQHCHPTISRALKSGLTWMWFCGRSVERIASLSGFLQYCTVQCTIDDSTNLTRDMQSCQFCLDQRHSGEKDISCALCFSLGHVLLYARTLICDSEL